MTDLANLRSLGLSIELTGPFRPAPELLFTYVREVYYNYGEKRRQVFVFVNHLNRIFVWNCHSDMLTKCVLLVLLTAIAAVDVSLGSLKTSFVFRCYVHCLQCLYIRKWAGDKLLILIPKLVSRITTNKSI